MKAKIEPSDEPRELELTIDIKEPMHIRGHWVYGLLVTLEVVPNYKLQSLTHGLGSTDFVVMDGLEIIDAGIYGQDQEGEDHEIHLRKPQDVLDYVTIETIEKAWVKQYGL